MHGATSSHEAPAHEYEVSPRSTSVGAENTQAGDSIIPSLLPIKLWPVKLCPQQTFVHLMEHVSDRANPVVKNKRRQRLAGLAAHS